mgnify:CR=1 FL=1
MFIYEKKLQYPVKIANTNPKLASIIISQYGGPDGELGASLRYLSQRFSMPVPELKATLTDIGVEELGHLEMIGTIVHQLTRNLTEDQIKTAGFDAYFVDHTAGVYPTAASGFPWNAASMQVKGDPIADLTVTEIYEFLRYLNAPECIINKAPSAALFDGQTDETEMGISYAALDAFLSGEAIDEETRQIIDRMHTVSEHKRAEIVRYSDNTIQ